MSSIEQQQLNGITSLLDFFNRIGGNSGAASAFPILNNMNSTNAQIGSFDVLPLDKKDNSNGAKIDVAGENRRESDTSHNNNNNNNLFSLSASSPTPFLSQSLEAAGVITNANFDVNKVKLIEFVLC